MARGPKAKSKAPKRTYREEPVAPPADPDAVLAVAREAAAAAGADVEDVQVKRAGSRTLVRVTVDLPEDAIGSMPLDDVAAASKAVSKALDAANLFAGSYTLEVSTPGTGRELRELRHFKRARTRMVHLTLNDGRTETGRLTKVSDSELTLVNEDSGAARLVPLADVVKGKIEVELSKAALADFGDEDGEA
ncbi:ribosome maturation factor RimP [Rarobacter incanus]|uniref:Ribosome maturation factor RimP n=1 Tax=Rarobacter incanus TaxID=153494 RepID=A0A542SLD1_9MICO|nr:ribosome maturation factor RimP [Rarobacter incanus]TQK75441.1 ribosome maturation factor RimP [Rarobacter incanus]